MISLQQLAVLTVSKHDRFAMLQKATRLLLTAAHLPNSGRFPLLGSCGLLLLPKTEHSGTHALSSCRLKRISKHEHLRVADICAFP
jgi:hypothetical protein